MRRPYAERVFGAPKPALVTRAIPPPVDTTAADFVGKFLLAGIAVMIAITLLALAPFAVAIPLGLVLVTYGVVALAIVGLENRADRPRPDSERHRDRLASDVAGSSKDPVDISPADANARDGVRRSVKRLALASIALLIAALTVAEPLGGAFAAAGMAGIFILRFRIAALIPITRARWQHTAPPTAPFASA